jgi:hypothetical protein
LNKFRQSLRSIGAWLLILLIVVQWIGGRVFINVVYTARIEHLMNAKETAIAQKLKAVIGVTANIKIQDKKDLKVVQGMGYGAPFLFSEESDGETQYYTVDAKSPHGLRHEYKVDQPQNQEDRSAPKTLTERFFSDFYFEEHIILDINPLFSNCTKTAQPLIFKDLVDLSDPSILTPPPQLA